MTFIIFLGIYVNPHNFKVVTNLLPKLHRPRMKICIIGGGTTGWWCASYMQKFLDADITLIESEDIPISGVGYDQLYRKSKHFLMN